MIGKVLVALAARTFLFHIRGFCYLCTMNFEKQLNARSGEVCELSGTTDNLQVYQVLLSQGNSADDFILITQNLKEQLEGTKPVAVNDWRCLNDAMWSEVSAVKVVAYRMLNQLKEDRKSVV